MKYYLFIKKDLKPKIREVLNSLVGEIENTTLVGKNSLGDNKFTRLFWLNSLGDNIIPYYFMKQKIYWFLNKLNIIS